MASRPTLNARSLEALGAARLAELLLLHTQGNAAARRALRLALAEQRGPEEMAQQVRQRLATIARSKRALDRKELPPLLADLKSQRQAICGPIAEQAPPLAVELLWCFLDLANSLLDRVDDSDQQILELFHGVSTDLGRLAGQVRPDPVALADQVAAALLDNRHGQCGRLVSHLAGALQAEGLQRLRQRLEAERPPRAWQPGALPENEADASESEGVLVTEVCPYLEPWNPFALALADDCIDDDDGQVFCEADPATDDVWMGQEPLGSDPDRARIEEHARLNAADPVDDSDNPFLGYFICDDPSVDPWERSRTVRLAMLAIADGLGDAQAYLAEYRGSHPIALRRPRIAAHVAQRLTAAGQPDQALIQLDRAVLEEGLRSDGARVWIDARLEALDALGRDEEAQRLRLRFALERLSLPHLRAYLQRLPVFEDGEAEEQALDAVLCHRAFNRALEFLHRWPDHRRAARLILERPQRLARTNETLLQPLAEILEAKGLPLAASQCLRAMVENILWRGGTRDQGRALDYLRHCMRLASSIEDWGTTPHHNAWVADLLGRVAHDRDFLNKLNFDPQLPA